MKRIGFLGLMAAVALTAACSDSNDSSTPQAQLRVVHASPDAPNVDVYLDGSKVLTNVPYLARGKQCSLMQSFIEAPRAFASRARIAW